MGILNLIFNVDGHICHYLVMKVICPVHPSAMMGYTADGVSEAILTNSYGVTVLVKTNHITESSTDVIAKMADGFLGDVISV